MSSPRQPLTIMTYCVFQLDEPQYRLHPTSRDSTNRSLGLLTSEQEIVGQDGPSKGKMPPDCHRVPPEKNISDFQVVGGISTIFPVKWTARLVPGGSPKPLGRNPQSSPHRVVDGRKKKQKCG
eukprot:g25294.t1